MDWVRRLTVLFLLLLNLLQHAIRVVAVSRELKKKKKGSAAYSNGSSTSSSRSSGIATQKRKGEKKFADNPLVVEVNGSEQKGKKGGNAGKERKSCKSRMYTKKKKKKKKSKKADPSVDDEEECIDEPTMLPTEAPTALPTLTPTARPSTLSLNSKKNKKKSKKEKTKKTSKRNGSQSDVAPDNREIVGWFSSIENVVPSTTAEGLSSSTYRPSNIEKQTQEQIDLSTAPPSPTSTAAPVPQERFGPKPALISSSPTLLELTSSSPQLYFRYPPKFSLDMPGASLSSLPAAPSPTPAIALAPLAGPSAAPLKLQLSQEETTATPVSHVSNSPTIWPEPSHGPGLHNITDKADNLTIRVGVPSFHVTYSYSNAYPYLSPSAEQLNQVAEITISYIDDFFDSTFSMVDVTLYDKVLGARTNIGTDGTLMEFLVAVDFRSSSQYLPSSSDLFILLQTAFAQPAAQTFIIMLRNLPLSNPLSFVDKVSISSVSIPNIQQPGAQSTKSDEDHYVLTGAVFTTFVIAGFVAVYRWKLSSSKKSERSAKWPRTRLDSEPGSITEQSLYSYSGIDKEEETAIQFDRPEPMSPASSAEDECLVPSDSNEMEAGVNTPLPIIQEDDDTLISIDEEAIEADVFGTSSPEEDDSVSSKETWDDDQATADGSKTAESDSSSSSDDVSFGSSTVGSLLFEDDDSTNNWDTV